MDDPSIADVDGHMVDSSASAVEYQIARPGFLRSDSSSLGRLVCSRTVEIHSCTVAQHIPGESGTIHSGMGVISSIDIGIAYKLEDILYQGTSDSLPAGLFRSFSLPFGFDHG